MHVTTITLITALLLFATVALLAYQNYQTIGALNDTLASLDRSAREQASAAASVSTGGDDKEATNALRLQACERFTLMTERIAVPNLLLRLNPASSGSAQEFTAQLLLTIREEFEYNVTQQIYVSDALWNVLLQARDNVSQLIVRAAEGADSAEQVASRLRLLSSRQPADAIALAQAAVRREAVQLLV
ncbi:hypothetical protein [Lewinella sp. 4G2]|uniref:DUF7935 family protein n=1 Tax=Lewinella sp. 4G2 TaxID=1803372 RepID=UPI0007B4EEE4|nr:hypothetical protein [Lewinella sp. 4G2]OAV43863.1 hypothetical protein A3850_004835 [Lewinella sp. 4G2]